MDYKNIRRLAYSFQEFKSQIKIMNIIINADDYGLSKGVNLGILEGFKNGIVTSATMMANMAGFSHGVELYKENEILSVGVHLTLTTGFPVLKDLKTIVSENGKFIDQRVYLENKIEVDTDEIKRELWAQINKIKNSGIKITHLDGHHHCHAFAMVSNVVYDIAKELNIPVRPAEGFLNTIKQKDINMPEYFDQSFYGENITEDYIISLLKKYETGTLEIMTHPAYIDQDLMDSTSYSIKRAMELKILCSSKVKEFIKNNNISLVNYKNYDIYCST